jgi:hypothetical protein
MLDRENCVARLRVLAEKLAQRPEGDVQGVLAQVLAADPTTMEFHRRLVDFEDLAKRAREQVAELADDPNYNLYMGVINQIVSSIEELNMRENWVRYREPFDQRARAFLETCERVVESRLRTALPGEETIREVLAEVKEAINTIRDADIDAEAKSVSKKVPCEPSDGPSGGSWRRGSWSHWCGVNTHNPSISGGSGPTNRRSVPRSNARGTPGSPWCPWAA